MFSSADRGPDGQQVPLNKWLWNSYVGAALVPLLLVELSFLGIYWGTGEFVYKSGAEAVTSLSTRHLGDAVLRESQVIANRLQTISSLTDVYADEAGRALSGPPTATEDEKARFAYSSDGAFYTTRDTGGSAVFYSGIVPVGEAERDKVWRTTALDPIMQSIVQADPLVAQVYLNTHDSLNRIYPYFDVLDIYAPKMDIPSYNFYYEADPEHNPDGKVVWTDAYIDPAGSGWMVSAIAPVMGEDKLEGVVGIDVTIAGILDAVLDIQFEGDGYAMLVGRDGTILALPPQGERDLGLMELIDHSYSEAILADTFKPSEFNVFRREDLTALAVELRNAPSGATNIDLGKPMLAAWSTVPGADWFLIGIASEESLLSEASSLRSLLATVSQIMLVSLVLFYLIFFFVLWRRSKSMSAMVAQPLAEIEDAMAQISEGRPLPSLPDHAVVEVTRLRDHLSAMHEKLLAADRAKTAFLSAMSHELRTPLNIIIGYSDILKRSAGKTLDGERMGQVESIASAGRGLMALVEGVIELSRLEQSSIQRPTSVVALGRAVETAVAQIRPLAQEKDLTIHVQVPSDLPGVRTDADAMNRILRELLTNAVKYNQDSGRIDVVAKVVDADWVTVAISDTGSGIPADKLKRAFVAFDRLGHENSTITGAGIGLTIVRRLCAVMGCSVSVDSVEGKGTTFTVKIPRPRKVN